MPHGIESAAIQNDMPRPKTKSELLNQSEKNFKGLNHLIDSLDEIKQIGEFPPGTMNRNIRDVLAHIYHWQLLFFEWYEIGMKGNKPEMPAKGHSWKSTPDLNREIWMKYQSADLTAIRSKLNGTHNKIQALIQSHTNEELFTKKKYKWTGSTSLGAYLISTTSSHYDWGLKLIRKSTK